MASRLLISLCSVPSASAYGLSNSNVYNSFLSCLTKVIGVQLKLTSVASSGGKSKKRTRRSEEGASDSDAEDGEQEDEEPREFNINIMPSELSQPTATLSQRTSARRPVGESVIEMSILKPLLTDLGDHIPFLAALSDEHLINSAAEMLTSLLFLCGVKLQNHSGWSYLLYYFMQSLLLCVVLGFVNQISKSIVEFGTSNQRALMAIYRSLMPFLTLAARNPMLPDVQKVRTAAHKVAVKVLLLSCHIVVLICLC